MKVIQRVWIAALVLGGSLHAQETGDVAAQTAHVAKTNNWQNWTFAGSLVLLAGVAIFVISIHDGNEAQSTSH